MNFDTKEIFRHLRPVSYDSTKSKEIYAKNGGISFLLLPTGEREYDYWIYICPLTMPFSSTAAVKSLRKKVENNIVPWSHITLVDDDILLLQLLRSIMTDNTTDPLFTTVDKLAFTIMMSIWAKDKHYTHLL